MNDADSHVRHRGDERARNAEATLQLAGVSLPTGDTVDVEVRGDQIAVVTPAGSLPPTGDRLELDGYLLLPAPAEPHAHLDKALTASRVPNQSGDLSGAIEAWRRYHPSLSHSDVVRHATAAALMALAHGATAVRTHVDVGVGLRGLEALLEVRDALRDQVSLQIVALAGVPLTGVAGAENRALLRAAVQAGADAVGACPHLDPDPKACHQECITVAAEHGVAVDLHTDETTDPSVLHLPDLADLVTHSRFPYGVAASHCVSLGMQAPHIVQEVGERVAAAGVAVICLPQTNLFLQARAFTHAPPRGLTAVRALLTAGVTVAGGGDNVQDPFNPLGRGDPLETASLLVAAGHLTPDQAYAAVSSAARAAMGLPEVNLRVGGAAELLAIRASSLPEAVAMSSGDRLVIHHGRVVSRTTVAREFPLEAARRTAARLRS